MSHTNFDGLLASIREHLADLLVGELEEITIKRKPSGKVHVCTKRENSHEVHEGLCGEKQIPT
jgi:hypothetical protein